ncbi:MAG: DUF1425 domain-containing protein [Saezia sp.]
MSAYAQTTYNEGEISQKITYQTQNTVIAKSLQSNTENGLLRIRAEVFNSSDQKVHLYYRVLWRNPQGQQVGADPWKPVLLLPNKGATINATAPLTNAEDFVLELKAD